MFRRCWKTKFSSKCKPAIKKMKTRIEMIKRRRHATEKFLRNDIAELLKYGYDTNAYDRAGGLLVEINRTECYDLIEEFTLHISSRLATMDKQSGCPEECREAVSSLIYGAAWFGDLPEMRQLRSLFTGRYGNSLDLYVNKQFVDKLKPLHPSKEMRIQLLQDIAYESGLDWNPKDLEYKLSNPPALEHKRSDETDLIEDIQLETIEEYNELNTTESPKSVLTEAVNKRKSLDYRSIPPPYIKSESNQLKSSSSVSSSSPDEEKMRDKEPIDSDTNQIEYASANPILKSVRNRRLRSNKASLDQSNGEDRMLDRLLQYVTRRRRPNGTGTSDLVPRPIPQHETSEVAKHRRKYGSDRASSLPDELANLAEVPKGYDRALSLQRETLDSNRREHSKSLDYDEFLARLEALKGK